MEANVARIAIDGTYCKGCGLCVDACPKNILELDMSVIGAKGYHPVKCTDESQCIGCKSCEAMCPDVAIQVVR